MGSLRYGNATAGIDFDDRALMHLQIVITGKLRRGESFLFSWTDGIERGSGRSSLWMDPAIPLMYRYAGNRTPAINRTWIAELTKSANSGSGLIFSPEPTHTAEPAAAPSEL